MFERLRWEGDYLLLDDLRFIIRPCRDNMSSPESAALVLGKSRRMVEQYRDFWNLRQNFRAQNILELGVFEGGSIAFWCEYFRPETYVAIDTRLKGHSEYFQQYVSSRALEERIRIYWGTSQADSHKLRTIVSEDMGGRLDLVIDDASHRYTQTKTSFETLFPLLRPGGIYVIEDWSWGCWPSLPLDFPLPLGSELIRLIFELVELTGSKRFTVGVTETQNPVSLIASLSIYQDFVVLERGDAVLLGPVNFKLEDFITRRPGYPSVTIP